MARGRLLTDNEKGAIDALSKEKLAVLAIAVRIGRSNKVVRNYLQNPDKYGKNYRGGRPKALDDRTFRAAFRLAVKGSSSTAIKATLGCSADARTIRRDLHNSTNLVYKRRKRSPMLTKTHKEKRVGWAHQNVDKGKAWGSVVFTDEKKFNLDGPDGCQYYWHDIQTEEEEFYSRQHGGGSVMMWAGFSANEKTEIAFLEGKQDSFKYIHTLSEYLLPFAHRQYGTDFVLQQDNASIHVSTETKAFFEEMGIDVMPWPAKSPDLNPIENLWGALVRRVYEGGRQYATCEQLRRAIVTEWSNIPQTTLTNLVDSMTRRCIQVLERHGKKTSY